MLLPKRRKVADEETVRFVCEYNKQFYNCTFYTANEEKLMVNVQIPEGFEKAAVDPRTFSDFEELLLSYDSISSLELFWKQLKSINFGDVLLAESLRIELSLLKMVNGSYVLYRKILEREGELMEYAKPTDYCIMLVYRDKSWECYDEECNFQVFCSVGGDCDPEIICEADFCDVVASKIELFRKIAKIMYKQNFEIN